MEPSQRTRWQGLLELVGLLGVLEDKGVQVTLAADLELDQGGLLAALDASRAGVLAAADLDELGVVSMASSEDFRVPEAERGDRSREERFGGRGFGFESWTWVLQLLLGFKRHC